MKTSDMILDVLSDVDEKYINEHARKTKPMRPAARYTMAAAGYIAACLVVALLIPLITGTSGNVNPGTQSGVTPGTQVSGDENEEEYPDAVSVYEVEKMIEVARAACNKNGIIMLSDGNELVCETVINFTKEDVKKIAKNGDEEELYKYKLYLENVEKVFLDMLIVRLPEDSIRLRGENEDHRESDYFFFLDLEGDGYSDAAETYNQCTQKEENFASFGPATVVRYWKEYARFRLYTPYQYDSIVEEIFPSGKESGISNAIFGVIDAEKYEEYKEKIMGSSSGDESEKITTADLVKEAFEAGKNGPTQEEFDPTSLTSITVPGICENVAVEFRGKYMYSSGYGMDLYTYTDEDETSYIVAENGKVVEVFFTKRDKKFITDEENKKFKQAEMDVKAEEFLKNVIGDGEVYELIGKRRSGGTSNEASFTYRYSKKHGEYYLNCSIYFEFNAAGEVYLYRNSAQMMNFDDFDFSIMEDITEDVLIEYFTEKYNNKELESQELFTFGELTSAEISGNVYININNETGDYFLCFNVKYTADVVEDPYWSYTEYLTYPLS